MQQFLKLLPNKTILSNQQGHFENTFVISTNDRKAIEIKTRTDIELWKAERTGGLTASNLGKILKCKQSPGSILLDIMLNKDVSSEAIAWDKTMKKYVLDNFFKKN